MRHGRAYRKLGRTKEHRRALLRNLVASLFTAPMGRITTTVEKAKEARRVAEKMITLGKREGVHARRLAARFLPDRAIVRRLFDDIAPKFANRNGGYTRVLRLAPRQGDNADMALLELVDIADELRKAKAAKDKAKKGEKEKKEAKGEESAADKEAKTKAASEEKARLKAERAEKKKQRDEGPKPSAKGKARSAAKSRQMGRAKGD